MIGRLLRSREPRFSIVIPTHNSREYVSAAIRSCLQQTDGDLEVIVVDDGSTDDTVAIVREIGRADQRVAIVATTHCSGAAARNTGTEVARGNLLTFLDSDDLLMPDYVAEVGRLLESNPNAGIAYGPAFVLDEVPRLIRHELDVMRYLPPEPLPDTPEARTAALLEGNFIGGVRTLRPTALAEVGGFDGTLNYVEDYDLWLRLIPRGWDLVRAERPLAILRDRPGGLHTDRPAMAATLARVMEKVASDDVVPVEQRELARRRRNAYLAEARATARLLNRALWRARVAAFEARRRLRPWSFWHRQPPPEIAVAFGDLSAL